MTAWQDQPPQGGKPLSRRQARQGERPGAITDAPDLAEQLGFGPTPHEGWDTEARRVAAVNPPAQRQEAAPPGRRSQRNLQAVEPQPEPLEYLTQGAPQAQSTDGESRRRSAQAVPDQNVFPFQVQPANYRVRDFSPEGRRSAFTATTPETPGDLTYRTQGATIPPASYQQPVQAPPAGYPQPAPQQQAQPIDEHTMSRRELRALQNASAPHPFAAPAPINPAPVNPNQFDPNQTNPAQFVPNAAVPQAWAPPPLVEPQQQAPAQSSRRRDRARAVAQDEASAALAEFDQLTGRAPQNYSQPQPSYPAPPIQEAPQPPAPNPFGELLSENRAEPSTFTPPTGHWSTQALIDDDEQFQENTLSRNVAATSGAITTSALVLPKLPSEAALAPLGSTGEILITGTINLPRSVGSSGMHPGVYDHSDVDAFIDASDREAADPSSQPVRAIKAVSTHTSTRGVIEAKKPKGSSRLPMILLVAATAMAIGVVVLVVAGLIFKVF